MGIMEKRMETTIMGYLRFRVYKSKDKGSGCFTRPARDLATGIRSLFFTHGFTSRNSELHDGI